MSYKKWSCQECRYRDRNAGLEPCITGTLNICTYGCCDKWKPRTWLQRVWDKLCAVWRWQK